MFYYRDEKRRKIKRSIRVSVFIDQGKTARSNRCIGEAEKEREL